MEHESVLIGDDIEITVVECRHGRTKLLIQAPKSVPIVRDELRKIERVSA